LLEYNDRRVANLVGVDVIAVAHLFSSWDGNPGQRSGADGLTQTSQVPLGEEPYHKEIVFVAIVQVKLANFAARDYHRTACIRNGFDVLSNKNVCETKFNEINGLRKIPPLQLVIPHPCCNPKAPVRF
jgi:hypothetical protein